MRIEGELRLDHFGLPYIYANNKRVYLHQLLERIVSDFLDKKVSLVVEADVYNKHNSRKEEV